MEKFLFLTTAAASLVAIMRIAVIAVKMRRREREITRTEAENRIVFHDEIDDVRVVDEIKKSFAIILILWVCPLSIFNLWYCSHAGTFSKIVSLVAIFYGYILAAKKINSQLF